MSHILDALRRAEDERRLGKPPDRGMIAGPLRGSPVRVRRGRWLLGIGALLLVLAVLLGYRGHLPGSELAPASTASPPTPAASPPPEPSAQEPALRPSAAPALDAPAERPELPRAQLPEAETIRNLDALFAEQAPEAAAPPASPGPDEPTPLAPRDVFQSAGEAGTPAPAASNEDDDLPSPRSAGMPDFTIQVHAWAPRPEERFIRVDGRRLTEGDSLPNGARIVRIARDGVVLEWRGQRLMRRLGR